MTPYIDNKGKPIRDGLKEIEHYIHFPYNEAMLVIPLEIANAFIDELDKFASVRTKEINDVISELNNTPVITAERKIELEEFIKGIHEDFIKHKLLQMLSNNGK